MTLQSDRGQALEARALDHLSTPEARRAISLADISQRTLEEFNA